MKNRKFIALLVAGLAVAGLAATFFGSVAVVSTMHGETNYLTIVLGNHAASVVRKISPSNFVDVVNGLGAGGLPRLATAASAAATSIVVTYIPSNVVAGVTYVVINDNTTNCEIAGISSTGARTVNIAGSGGAFPLKYSHAAGTRVKFIDGSTPIPLTWFGGVPNVNTADGAAVNVTAFNRASTNLYLLTGLKNLFLDGEFYINGECRIERDLYLTGRLGFSGLTAHSSFDFSANAGTTNESVAMLHWQRDGVLANVTNGGPLTKIYMDGFRLDGQFITNSVGVIACAQQQAYVKNFRADNCDDGFILVLAQIYLMENCEFVQNRRAMWWRTATMVWCYNLNFQKNIEREFYSDSNDGEGACNNNHFIGLEIEPLSGAAPTYGANFTMHGNNWEFKNVVHSNPTTGGKTLRFMDGYLNANFTIEGMFMNNGGDYIAVEDVTRGISRTSDAINRSIQKIDSGLYSTYWNYESVGSSGGSLDPPPWMLNGISLSRRTNYAGAWIRAGAGNPEGAITADVGCIYMSTNGGAGATLYVKESGFSSTGWVAK